MLSISLPFKELVCGNGLGSDGFLEKLNNAGAESVELRAVMSSQNPDSVLLAAERIWNHNMQISVHTAPRSADEAVCEVFRPLEKLLNKNSQENIILVLHPVKGENLISENIKMLGNLTDKAHSDYPFVRLALENNRRMPDKSEGDSASLVMKVISESDPEYTGICFDFGHYAWATKVWETDKPSIPPEAFTKRVIHTHIHALAGPEREYTTHFPLQLGSLPLRNYIEAIGPDYKGAYNLELEQERFSEIISGEDAIIESLDVLRCFCDKTI